LRGAKLIGKIPEELMESLFEILPVDINVIDADDKLIARTKQDTRLFKILEKAEGENIRKCHPPHRYWPCLKSFSRK